MDGSGSNAIMVRPPQSVSELDDLFRLRRWIYQRSPLRPFMGTHPHPVDLDVYDVNACHLGLYMDSAGDCEPVGYMRAVTAATGPQASLVRAVAARYSGLEDTLSDLPEWPLPVLNYFPQPEPLRRWYRDRIGVGRGVAEPGRVMLLPRYRNTGIARSMSIIIAAECVRHGFRDALWGCSARHTRYYQALGCLVPKGICPAQAKGVDVNVLVSSWESLPAGVRRRIQIRVHEQDACGRMGIVFENDRCNLGTEHPGERYEPSLVFAG